MTALILGVDRRRCELRATTDFMGKTSVCLHRRDGGIRRRGNEEREAPPTGSGVEPLIFAHFSVSEDSPDR